MTAEMAVTFLVCFAAACVVLIVAGVIAEYLL